MKLFIISLLLTLNGIVYGRVISNIVGGSNATSGEFPHQGSLQLLSGGVWYHTCGCVLYAPNRALTAAHCVTLTETSYRIAFGVHSMNVEDESRQYSSLDSYSVHPGYSGSVGTYPNDIAVLRMSTSMVTSPVVSPIPLASGSEDFAEQDCILSGWGRLTGGGAVSDILQKLSMRVLSNTECASRWGAVIGAGIDSGHICTFEQGTNACHVPQERIKNQQLTDPWPSIFPRSHGVWMPESGDYGGALVCGGSLAGILSWALTNCDGLYPTVSSRVSYFYDWIEEQ